MVNKTRKPQLHWLDAEEIAQGHFEPNLTQILHVPGQTGHIGRGIEIVRGNILRGRPRFPDSLNIRYLDDTDTDELPVNDTLHDEHAVASENGETNRIWRGPIIAFLKAGNDFDAKKMTDMTLTAYRDAIDYLHYFYDGIGSMIDQPGPDAVRSKYVMENRSAKVKGVRINCEGDQAGDPTRQLLSVDVPRTHPVFTIEDSDPMDIAQAFGESWVVYRYAGYQDSSVEEAQNFYGSMLQLAVAKYLVMDDSWGVIPDWRLPNTSGSLLVVDQAENDLDIRKVEAVCRLIEARVLPLLLSEHEFAREAVLETLTLEILEQYL